MKILLVEDDRMIGESLNGALKKSGYALNWVTDGEMACDAVLSEVYDLIILDLGLPKKSGLDVLKGIRSKGSQTPVLVLTAKDSVSDRVSGLDAGADDYVLKPFSLEELEARIRRLLRREAGQASAFLIHGDIKLDPKTHEVWFHDKEEMLSGREFALLFALMKKPNAVLSRAQLEEALYGWNEEIGSNAVEVHIHQIRKKLGRDIIKNIRNVGYALNHVGKEI